ncbi:hypothetical protein CR513_49537, partial [Mucuna pruriens]
MSVESNSDKEIKAESNLNIRPREKATQTMKIESKPKPNQFRTTESETWSHLDPTSSQNQSKVELMPAHLVSNLNQVGQSDLKPIDDIFPSPPPPVELK